MCCINKGNAKKSSKTQAHVVLSDENRSYTGRGEIELKWLNSDKASIRITNDWALIVLFPFPIR